MTVPKTFGSVVDCSLVSLACLHYIKSFFSFSFSFFLWGGGGGGKKRAVMGNVMTVNPVSL